MPSAARQLAPHLALRPLTTPNLYRVVVRLRRISIDHGLRHVTPALDALVDRCIRLSHRQHRWATEGRDPVPLLSAAARLAEPLATIHDRLDQHADHPGISALRAAALPDGLSAVLALPPRARSAAVAKSLTVLLSPAHRPYLETAGLIGAVHTLSRLQRALHAAETDPTAGRDDLEAERIDLHHHLGLLLVRMVAACWSERPAHVRCRSRVLEVWARCSERTPSDPAVTAPPPAHRPAQVWIGQPRAPHHRDDGTSAGPSIDRVGLPAAGRQACPQSSCSSRRPTESPHSR